MDVILIVLLALHITFIALWAGGATILSSIILPSIGKISPASRKEFIIGVVPRYARFIAATSIGAAIFGILLFGYETGVATVYAPSSTGIIFIEAGAIVGLIALVLALGVAYPTANRLVRTLKNQTPESKPDESIPKMQARMRMTAGAVTGLLGITLVLMVIGATV